ncbi:phosphate signaling complex protein PhoU [Oleiharenicola sp. Vm1]|uniref:phosphate signaling complex protein PhoU n=1 Tax=Oleiharenicola sp. Vm1 TaxID=3398393 RepID=UPI0039F48503
MKRFFDAELETLRTHLLQMGDRAIDQTRRAIRALAEGDLALADKVIAADDEIDKFEVQIDEEAIRYMTLRGPVASELRLVIVGMKASHDLERVGDEATSIARRARKLAIEPKVELYADIPRMANIALEMLRDALDCFVNEDEQKALAVIRRDPEVDNINRLVYRRLTSYMLEKPETIAWALELMFVSKSIERIADHATNIAEEMIYLVRGKDVRHSEELKQAVQQTPPAEK